LINNILESIFYERLNHLGNVQVVVSDKRISVCDSELEVEYFKAEVLSAVDYYPFGMMMPDRQWYANSDSSSYRYGFNGQEKDNEVSGIGNSNTAEFWQYDTRLGRRFNVDPIVKHWESSYSCFSGNPIFYVDIDGNTASKHTDEEGNIIAEYDDGDDGVYYHTNRTTQADVDKQRTDNRNTAGCGIKIGEIGGTIDISRIMRKKHATTAKEAKDMDMADYFSAVKPGGKWDLKNNTNTIFGVAWKHDDDNKTETKFEFGANQNMTAADVGNYHAGYAGRYTYEGEGMSYFTLWYGAGAAELAKSISEGRFLDANQQIWEMKHAVPPYGDRKTDFKWNTRGMVGADANKKLEESKRKDTTN